jgi:hypothetical protein
MEVNWLIVATIAAPIIALFVGAALDRFIERKPKVSYYLGHASAFNVGSSNQLHTHSIVIMNYGRKTATGVKVIHDIIPENFNVYPKREYEKKTLSEGGAEIVFPKLVPSEQVTISYLYYPPVTWNQFNTVVKHDDGLGKAFPVLPTRQFPKWQLRVGKFLLLLGIIASIYLLYEILSRFIKLLFLSG